MAQSTSSTGNQPLIELRHVDKHYGDLHVLNDINLSVDRGEVVVVIGPSGSGKSTMLRCINRLEHPTSGSIIVEGVDVCAKGVDLNKVRTHLGMVFQQFNLFPHLSVKKNVMLAQQKVLKRSKEEAEKIAVEELTKVGLAERIDFMPSQLSGGQRQRVAIARALSLNPDAIIADEPTSALDVSVRAQILNLLTDLKKELGLAMVFISHDIQTVRYISDDIIVMNGGRIVEQGEAKQVFQHPQDPYTKMLLGAAPSLLHPKLGE